MAIAPKYDISINGRGYMVDYTNYRRRTIPAQKEQRDTSEDVGENTLSNVGQWVRSQSDWSHGAGQEFFDLNDSDRRRFHTSKNIDIFTKGQLHMCKAIEEKSSGSNNNLYAKIVNGSVFYFSDGQLMKFGNPDVNAGSYSPSSIDMDYAILDWTSDGASIYCAQGANGVRKATVSSTSGDSTIGSFQADVIEYANGRLLASDAGRIVELNTSGVVQTFDKTLTGTCKAIKGGPNSIYAAYNVNGQGILYTIGISTTDGSLAYPVPAAVLPLGETFSGPCCIDTFGELIVVGTSAGARFGLINSNDQQSVTFGPVIDTGGAAYGVRISGKYGYWGTKNGDTYKADLSIFTDTLVPAYCRLLSFDDAAKGNVLSLELYNNKLFFTVSAGELYGEDATGDLSATAELTVGTITFGTSASKVGRAASGRFAKEQAASASGDIDYSVANTDYQASSINYGGLVAGQAGTVTVTATDENNVSTAMVLEGTGIESSYSAADPSSETFTIKLTLNRDAGSTTSGPIFERWSFHPRPQPVRIEELITPLIIQGRVTTMHGSGAFVGYDSQEEYLHLRNLANQSKAVTFEEGNLSYSVTVEDIEMSPVRMSADDSFWEGTLICRLLTVP
ncbi:MAG: hypothetical protein CMG34_04825 [Candidatus Marinimicrobia bacterium]|nr:hypothetical protein [Candidatus Neomarinimicrobiota bacterium]